MTPVSNELLHMFASGNEIMGSQCEEGPANLCGANWTKIVASASDVTLRCYIAVIGVGRPEIDRWSLGVVYLCEVCYKYVDLIQLEWP